MHKHARLTLDLPLELHEAVKIRAAQRRQTMSVWLRDVIEDALEVPHRGSAGSDPLEAFVGKYSLDDISAPADLVTGAEHYVRENLD